MNKQEHCASIDLGDLANVTGGWNPFKSAWNGAKQLGHEVVNATVAGVDYVKQHPEILLETARGAAV